MKEKTMGDRMKRYEMEEAGRRMMPRLPIMARLDGRAFHTFTRGLERPFDARFSLCMIETMKHLVKRFHATLAYTQSDEIQLVWLNEDPMAQMQFDGRYQKWVSLLASCASVAFYKEVQKSLPQKAHLDPEFDCRVWQVPDEQEVFHNFLWREQDATTNSLQMAAQSHYSHKQLHLKSGPLLHDMLWDKGINWNNYPAFFKRGTYARRVVYMKTLTEAELKRIKEDRRPTGPVMRTGIMCIDMPPTQQVGNLQGLLTRVPTRMELE